MLYLKFIRDNKKLVEDSIRDRGLKIDIDEFLKLDEEHRKLLVEEEGLKSQRNKANDEISALMKANKNPKELIDKMKTVSQKISGLDKKVEEIYQKIAKTIYLIPNIPHEAVSKGGSESNKIVRAWG